MAAVTRDADGWKDRVEYMRTAMHFSSDHLTDQDADDIASYLTSLFGPDSVLPKSPADMPGYKDTVRPFSSDAMNIVYVEYDMPGPEPHAVQRRSGQGRQSVDSEFWSREQDYAARIPRPAR